MRGKRAKKYRKLMHQYELNFKFREPYQVLLDSQILQDAAQKKIDIIGRLKGVLGGEVKPMITQCDMRHLYGAEPKDEGLILQAKEYERRRCNHHELEKPLTSLECLTECVDPKGTRTNKNRYVVATQDPRIRQFMRRIPGVPLIYVSKSVMILEPMAAATEDLREREEKAKFKAGLKGRRGANTGEKRRRDDEDVNEERTQEVDSSTGKSNQDVAPKKKRRKGPKEPNPLSMKKAKKQAPTKPQSNSATQSSSSNAETRLSSHATDSSTRADGEPENHKRRRKHKPKGVAGQSPSEQIDTVVP